jgi:hypothetical protein
MILGKSALLANPNDESDETIVEEWDKPDSHPKKEFTN